MPTATMKANDELAHETTAAGSSKAYAFPSQAKTLTVEAAARELNISRGLAYEGVRTGAIPAIRIGRRVLVPRAALDRLLAGDAA